VTNLSIFPLTLTEVGLKRTGTTDRDAFPTPIVMDGRPPYPRRLESRESITFYVERERPVAGRYKHAYATTSCGLTFKGKGPALDQLNHE